MRGSGGSEGGVSTFFIGLIMLAGGCWLFLDAVWVDTASFGYFGRYVGGSTLIVLFPLILGIFLLFWNSSSKIGWVITGLGFLIIAAEVLSRLQFRMSMKLWHLVILLVLIFGGFGLIVRSFRETK